MTTIVQLRNDQSAWHIVHPRDFNRKGLHRARSEATTQLKLWVRQISEGIEIVRHDTMNRVLEARFSGCVDCAVGSEG